MNALYAAEGAKPLQRLRELQQCPAQDGGTAPEHLAGLGPGGSNIVWTAGMQRMYTLLAGYVPALLPRCLCAPARSLFIRAALSCPFLATRQSLPPFLRPICHCRCLDKSEPALLVGETGTGKTTVCQLAAMMRGQRLHVVNCNQHTEASDFLGGYRPAR